MIVLNEVKYAEYILRTGTIDKKPSSTISILAKYYRQELAKNEQETIELIDDFMSKNYPFYNKVLWQNTITNIVKKINKYNIRKIESIEITESEINKIKELKNEKLERLLFTMLCIAKTYNKTSDINNGWINTDVNDIYKIARVSVKQAIEKHKIIHELIVGGYLETSKKNTNMNLRVTFIDNSSPVVMNIRNLKELGYEYMNYENSSKFYRCKECGILFKRLKGSSAEYCKEHSGYQKKGNIQKNCIDCGKIIYVDSKNTKTCRCLLCQYEEDKIKHRERQRKYVDKNKK